VSRRKQQSGEETWQGSDSNLKEGLWKPSKVKTFASLPTHPASSFAPSATVTELAENAAW